MKSTSKKRTPSIVNLTVKRRYLTQREIERMDCARKHGRYGHRDATMILVAYRHGLRASEVCDLQWQQIELSRAACTFTGSRTGSPAYIQSAVTRCERCASYAAITRETPMCSFPSAVGRSAPLGSTASSSASGRPPRCHSRSTRTCSAMPVVQARQRWPRHAGLAALPWTQEHSAHRQVHRIGAQPIQRLLEGLTPPHGRARRCGRHYTVGLS